MTVVEELPVTKRSSYLIEAAHGGLCNRMLAQAVAAGVAKINKIPLLVLWRVTHACPGFPENGFDLSSIPWRFATTSEFVTAKKEPAALQIISTEICTRPKRMADFFSTTVSIASDILQGLRPSKDVAVRLAALRDRLPVRTKQIGVHIRRTDMISQRSHEDNQRRQNSRLDQLLEKRPDITFVLAADNAESVEYYKKRYGKRIVATGAEFNSNPSRLRQTTMTDAVYDLFALSRTSMVIGTHWSTFSDMAAWMGEIPLEKP